MTELEFTGRIIELARHAENVLGERFDFVAAEPIFDDVLRVVTQEPDRRGVFCRLLVELLRSNAAPPELVAYCAHALRWPELKAAIEKSISSTHDRRMLFVLRNILDAFDDDWDQRDIYRRWRNSPS